MDATAKKAGLLLTLVSLVLLLTAGIPLLISVDFRRLDRDHIRAYYIGFLLCLLVYLVLHELVHGAAYKALTRRKLTFGLSWSCAFCGVPDIFVYRRTALVAVTMPLIVFSVLFLTVMAISYHANMTLYLFTGLLFAAHLSGCSGDLYITLLLLTKYRDPRLLMRDTGPAQTFYLPDD